ncbi:MAG: hypothetical protein PHS93_09890 [Candidatus Omnitrophica bacterium]|jgi:hypothetical protein|nr:hypothetical protein [Candidatus Omnitrophota bacterium]
MPETTYNPYSKTGYYLPEEIASGKYNPASGGRREQVWGGLWTTNPNVENPFKNLDYYGYDDMSKIADELATKQSTDAMRKGRKNMGNLRLDAAERLASQGITGGSYFDTVMSGAEDRANTGTIEQLNAIDTARMGQTLPMMESDNEMGFNIATAASNIDLRNLANTLMRLGMLGDYETNWANLDAENEEANYNRISDAGKSFGDLAYAYDKERD